MDFRQARRYLPATVKLTTPGLTRGFNQGERVVVKGGVLLHD